MKASSFSPFLATPFVFPLPAYEVIYPKELNVASMREVYFIDSNNFSKKTGFGVEALPRLSFLSFFTEDLVMSSSAKSVFD